MEITYRSDTNTEYREYFYRYVIAALFIMATFANSLLYSTFSAFATRIVSIYNVSSFEVNITSLIFMLFHPIFSFFANFTLDTYGIKAGLMLGLTFSILGAWIRIFVNTSFWYAILGQSLAAIGNPFVTNAPSQIASNWFFPKHRAIVTTVLALSISLSGVVSVALPSLAIDLTGLDDDNAKGRIFYLLYLEAIIVTCSALPCYFLFKDQPPSPPSFTASVRKENFLTAVKIISTNKNYLFLLLATGMLLGTFNSIVVVISYLTAPFIVASEVTAVLAISIMFGGAIGAVYWNIYLKKTEKYRQVLVYTCIIAVFGICFFAGLLYTDNEWLLIIATFTVGFSVCPFFPLSLEYGCELIFPVGEGSAAGFLLASVHFFGLTQGVIVSFIADGSSKMSSIEACIWFLGSFLLANVFLMFNKEELKRTQMENLNESTISPLSHEKNSSSVKENKGEKEENEDQDENEENKLIPS